MPLTWTLKVTKYETIMNISWLISKEEIQRQNLPNKKLHILLDQQSLNFNINSDKTLKFI